MVEIGVISDTHLKAPDRRLKWVVETLFKDTEMIIHAGDLTDLSVLDAFSGKELIVVAGNMDNRKTRASLQQKTIIEVLGFKIGIIHGWGSPSGIEEKLVKEFEEIDAIVYGHTHKAVAHRSGRIFFFNPGAYSGSFLFGKNRSVGLLQIGSKGISGKILSVKHGKGGTCE